MFEPPPAGMERLALQPILIPRRYDAGAGELQFYIVFSFIRQGEAGYHPRVRRKNDAVQIPDCLAGPVTIKLRTGEFVGYWPRYVDTLIKSKSLTLNLFADHATTTPFYSTNSITLRRPRDLEEARWDVVQADTLWRRLMVPAAEASAKGAERSRVHGAARAAGFAADPGRAPRDELDPSILAHANPNPWSASDLRPGHRLESINTRRVAQEIESFIVETGASGPPADPVKLLKESGPDLLRFVELRDSSGEYASLLAALQRPDPKFEQEILPALIKTETFQDAVRLLTAWRGEYLLAPSRSEFLRQSRFVDSARHRVPGVAAVPAAAPAIRRTALADDADAAAASLTFEDRVAQLRQHPGLMRRLYLTLSCSIAWRPGMPGFRASVKDGAIGLSGTIDRSPFVCLTVKTSFDMDCNPRDPYFRPAPKDRLRFYGRADQQCVAEAHFRRYHALSKDLYQVTQEDPSPAMLRAAQGVADGNQASPQEVRTVTREDGSLVEPNDALHRINAVNIYQRAFRPNGDEMPTAEVLKQKSAQDLKLLTTFNEHVATYLIAARRAAGPVRTAGLLGEQVQPDPHGCPPLFYAETLMMGYSAFAQPVSGRGSKLFWRSLHRRQVTLTVANTNEPLYRLVFEEEGFVATSVVTPPRPQTGTVTAAPAPGSPTGKLAYNLVGAGNLTTGHQSVDLTEDTAYINQLDLFNATEALRRPRENDVALVALVGKTTREEQTHPPIAAEVFVHPVLRCRPQMGDVLADRISAEGFRSFDTPVVLECQNKHPSGAVVRPDDWQARIVFAPHFTRLVDYVGGAIEPVYLKQANAAAAAVALTTAVAAPAPPGAPDAGAAPRPKTPFLKFIHFTAEALERNFALAIGESPAIAQLPPDDAAKDPARFVMTNAGPINQVVLPQLGKRAVATLRLPNPNASLSPPTGLVNPLPVAPSKPIEGHTFEASWLPDAKVQIARGWVRKVGFVFVLGVVAKKPDGASHEFIFSDKKGNAVATWYVPKPLTIKWGPAGTDVPLKPIRCDASLMPKAMDDYTFIARGAVEFVDGANPSISPTVEQLEVSVPTAKVDDGGIPLRWTLDVTGLDGGTSQWQFDARLVLPAKPIGRFVHPLQAGNQFLEIVTEDPAPTILVRGWPQRLCGTFLQDAGNASPRLRFADSTEIRVQLKPGLTVKSPTSGFFPVTASAFSPANGQPAPVVDAPQIESLLFAGEVSRASDEQVELTDSYGQTWTFPATSTDGVSQLDVNLPLMAEAYSVRKLRHLIPGEWLVAACHLDGKPGAAGRTLRMEVGPDPAKLARGFAILFGRIAAPPPRAISQASEGAVEFRPCTYRSQRGRELTVWTGARSTLPEYLVTAWSQRLVLATTLSQYEVPKPVEARGKNGAIVVRRASLQAHAAADEPPPDPEPRHLMVSELITRWANWGLGLEQPGRADEEQGPAPPKQDVNYRIALSRPPLPPSFPGGAPPFDRDSWLLPPLRFDQDYRFCLRRVDLAGNHLYDEAWLPPNADQSLYAELETLVNGQSTPVRTFYRANLPVAPIIAFTPDRLRPTLPPAVPPPLTTPAKPPATLPATGFDACQVAHQFLYLPSEKREPLLVLLTDVLDPKRRHGDDSYLELLPPPIDVETMLLHGCLDGMPAHEAAGLIQRHERYLDLGEDCRVLGRLRSDRTVNYIPDPMAASLSFSLTSATTKPLTAPPLCTHFYHFGKYATPGPLEVHKPWPHVRWIRLALKSVARRRRRGLDALPLHPPQAAQTTDAATVAVYLPPGVTGQIVLSVRPPTMPVDSGEYARMVRDHGSDTRTIRLVHATNGAWIRPTWTELAELPRDPQAAATPLRDLDGLLTIDRLTTGACAVTAYWNDPWDELVPVQHEDAHAVVEVDEEGRPVVCKLLDPGFGFGTQAVAIFESTNLPYRKPTFRPLLRCGQLIALHYLDPGVGCNVRFRVVVTQAWTCCCHHLSRPAVAEAWHDENGKLFVRIIDPGAWLGPYVYMHVTAERQPLPALTVTLKDGHVDDVVLASPGPGRFVGELHVRIIRRPPFYRVAEARVTAFDAQGGISKVEILDGGGWYMTPPHCVVHDPGGDGFGAILAARLDEYGGVIGVEIMCRGRGYSPNVRVDFYNQISEIPEQAVDDPTAAQIEEPLRFKFRHAFPDANARRVDYFARALSRFRQYLFDDPPTPTCFPELTEGRPLDIRRHVPRVSPVRQIEVVGHVRPEKPDINYMMPSFDWEVVTPKDEPELDPQDYFVSRLQGRIVTRRDARIRVYLNRPWHSTGPELVAVIVAPATTNTTFSTAQPKLSKNDGGVYNPAATPNAEQSQPGFLSEPVEGYAIDDAFRLLVSRWGYDPAWNEAAFSPLSVDHFPTRRPVLIYDDLGPAQLPANGRLSFRRPVWLALHEVHHDGAKDLWYTDIQIDVSAGGPAATALPFVRLGLARYQEHGLEGARLSPVSLCEMYKLMGRRDLEVERHSERRFTIRLRGEFDMTPDSAGFPRREVFVRLEARDPELSPDVVHHAPPGTPRGAAPGTADRLAEFRLARNAAESAYSATVEFPPEVMRSAQFLHGKPSIAVLSVVEYEIFPTSESQADSTGVEVLVLENRLCARRLVYSSTFHLSPRAAKP